MRLQAIRSAPPAARRTRLRTAVNLSEKKRRPSKRKPGGHPNFPAMYKLQEFNYIVLFYGSNPWYILI